MSSLRRIRRQGALACRLALFIGAGLWLSPAEARVFSFADSSVAAYVRGTGGMSALKDNAFAETSGSSTNFDEKVDYNFSGEIGFAFLLNEKVTVRAGFEGLQTKTVRAPGENSSGAKLLDVASQVSAFNPNLSFDFMISDTGTARVFGYLGVGFAQVKVTNEYENVTGYSATQAAYKETWVADAISYHVGVGWEYFLLDNVTMALEAGYRILKADGFKYKSDTYAIRGAAQSAVEKGADVLDNDGKKPELNLGGLFLGLAFRFYLPSLN